MKPQPARRKYFFGKAFADFGRIFLGSFRHNFNSVRSAADAFAENSARGFILRTFLGILNGFRIVSVAVVGTIVTFLLSLMHLTGICLISLILSIVMLTAWICDTLYLSLNSVFKLCPMCNRGSRMPIYVCPVCQKRHDTLVPSVYGIFRRTCECGHKLPTAFFNGRGSLPAVCPHCDQVVSGREARPLSIPVIGGRSVGKTAFITAFSYDFIESIAGRHGLRVDFDSDEARNIYNSIRRDYELGQTRMTHVETDVNRPGAEAFSFRVSGEGLSVDRQIALFDIAGEVFTTDRESVLHEHYKHSNGIVIMIDPFSIYDVRERYELSIPDTDKASISDADTDAIINSFYRKLAAVTGMGEKRTYDIPVAIVISKCDSPGVRDEIGEDAVRAQLGRFNHYYAAQDHLCRDFLQRYGMGSILNLIANRFPNNRCFACSSIGHTRGAGRYAPYGVTQPVEWIAKNADRTFGAVWNETSFQN